MRDGQAPRRVTHSRVDRWHRGVSEITPPPPTIHNATKSHTLDSTGGTHAHVKSHPVCLDSQCCKVDGLVLHLIEVSCEPSDSKHNRKRRNVKLASAQINVLSSIALFTRSPSSLHSLHFTHNLVGMESHFWRRCVGCHAAQGNRLHVTARAPPRRRRSHLTETCCGTLLRWPKPVFALLYAPSLLLLSSLTHSFHLLSSLSLLVRCT
jgi:hypothetical protein